MSRLPLRGHREAQKLLNRPSNGEVCRQTARLTLARVVLAYIETGEIEEAKRVLKQTISEASKIFGEIEEEKGIAAHTPGRKEGDYAKL